MLKKFSSDTRLGLSRIEYKKIMFGSNRIRYTFCYSFEPSGIFSLLLLPFISIIKVFALLCYPTPLFPLKIVAQRDGIDQELHEIVAQRDGIDQELHDRKVTIGYLELEESPFTIGYLELKENFFTLLSLETTVQTRPRAIFSLLLHSISSSPLVSLNKASYNAEIILVGKPSQSNARCHIKNVGFVQNCHVGKVAVHVPFPLHI